VHILQEIVCLLVYVKLGGESDLPSSAWRQKSGMLDWTVRLNRWPVVGGERLASGAEGFDFGDCDALWVICSLIPE
jgi:hypothetical protein